MRKIKKLSPKTRFLCTAEREYDVLIEYLKYSGFFWADGSDIDDLNAWEFMYMCPQVRNNLVIEIKAFKLISFTNVLNGDEIPVSNSFDWLKGKKYLEVNNER